MRISKKCQYALRAVFELSWRNTSQPVKISEIARAQHISARFLEVILNQLRHSGFVESRRGNEGGYLLARPAEEITVGQIIESVQGPISVIPNDEEKVNNNGFLGNYAFEQLWQRVNSQVSKIYSDVTLAELVKNEMEKKTASVPNYTI